MKIFIKPKDTLFFRDGRPFTMGEQTEGYGIFPPFPSTIYGAIRTAYIAKNGGLKKFLDGDMRAEIGTPNEKGTFKIKNVLVSNGISTLYPAPRDLVRLSRNGSSRKLELKENILKCALTELPLLWNCEDGKVAYNEFDCLTQEDIIAYLEGKETTLKTINLSKYLVREPKVGIKRNSSAHTSEEGKLYRISMIRLKDGYGLLVEYDGIDLEPSGFIRLGGEGKIASYSIINSDFNLNMDSVAENIDKTDRLKIYFVSPTIFKNGWLPDGFDIEKGIWGYKNLKLKLIGASIGKPVNIGGWDIAHNKPKIMRRAVPAGSVYYFEIIEGRSAETIQELNGQNITDYLSDEGFGYCLVGVV